LKEVLGGSDGAEQNKVKEPEEIWKWVCRGMGNKRKRCREL